MPLPNPFRRQPKAPTLRDRAAALRARFTEARPHPAPQPSPGSEEARAAWHAACHEHSARTAPLNDCPELMCPDRDVWSVQSLGTALETGQITAAEFARLHPLASERELRFAEITHELNIGGLFALAHADSYPVKEESAVGSDPIFAAIEAEAAPGKLVRDILDGWAAWGAVVNKIDDSPEGTAAWDRSDAQRDRLLDAAMALPATPENIAPKALACAWMEWVCAERPGQLREAYGPADQLVYDIHATIMGREAPAAPQPATARPEGIDLVSRIDFAAATMNELLHIRSIAEHIGSTAYAHHQGIRCEGGRNAFGFRLSNDLGKLMISLGDALTEVESAANAEAKRRTPNSAGDRQTRLFMLAPAAIDNDEPDEIEAFALELLAYAAAERARG